MELGASGWKLLEFRSVVNDGMLLEFSRTYLTICNNIACVLEVLTYWSSVGGGLGDWGWVRHGDLLVSRAFWYSLRGDKVERDVVVGVHGQSC